MPKKAVIIHTSFVSIEKLKTLCANNLPGVTVHHIVDDSLLAEVMENNGITSGITERMGYYVQSAEIIGADVVLSQCSSMGEAIDIVQKSTKIPLLKIDQAMAEQAVEMGEKIAVVATVASTLKPSCNLLLQVAKERGRKIELQKILVDGALDILLRKGNKEMHNSMVLEKIKSLDGSCDVIVLAQGSMVVLLPELAHIKTPILTSPESGIKRLKSVLELD